MTQKRKRRAKTTPRRRQNISKRKSAKMAARVRWADTPTKKKNPPKMKRLNKSTIWIPATAVKIRRNKGRYEVLIRKKRPARRKTATKRRRR